VLVLLPSLPSLDPLYLSLFAIVGQAFKFRLVDIQLLRC